MGESRIGLWTAFIVAAVLALVFFVLWFMRGGDVDSLTRNLDSERRLRGDDVARMERDVAGLKVDLDTANRKTKDLEQQLVAEKVRADRAASEAERHSQAAAAGDSAAGDLRKRLADAEKAAAATRNDLAELTRKLSSSEAALEAANARVKELEGLREEADSLRASLSAATRELAGAQAETAKIAEIEANLNAALAGTEKLAADLKTAQTENERLAAERNATRAELQKLAADGKAAQDQIAKLTELLREAKTEAVKVQANGNGANLQRLAEAERAGQAEIAKLTAALADARAEVERLSSADREAKAQMARLAAAEKEARAEAEKLSLANRESKTEMARLAASEKEARDALAAGLANADQAAGDRIASLQAELDAARQKLDLSTRDDQTLRSELEKLAASEKAAKAEIEKLTSVGQAAQSEAKSMTEAIKLARAEKDAALSELEKLAAAQPAMRDEVTRLRDAEQAARAEAAKLAAALGEAKTVAEAELAALSLSLREQGENAQAAKREIEILAGRVQDLEKRLATAKETEIALADLRKEAAKLRYELDENGKKLTRSEADAAERGKRVTDLLGKVDAIESTLAQRDADIERYKEAFGLERPVRPVGKIVDARDHNKTITIDLGAKQRLRPGMKFDVYRQCDGGHRYVGMVKVVKVGDTTSLAVATFRAEPVMVCPVTGFAVLEPGARFSPFAQGPGGKPLPLVDADTLKIPTQAPATGDLLANPFYDAEKPLSFVVEEDVFGSAGEARAMIETLGGAPKSWDTREAVDFAVVKDPTGKKRLWSNNPRMVTREHLMRYYDPSLPVEESPSPCEVGNCLPIR